jgi:tight adherence protein B
MELVAALVAGCSVLLLMVYAVRARALRPSEARLRRLVPVTAGADVQTQQGALLRRGASSIPVVERIMEARGWSARWGFDLERAGLRMRAGEFLLMRAALAVIALALFVVIGRSPLALLLGAVAAVILWIVPGMWLSIRIKRRISAIDKQLVEAITLISGALRAGFGFAQGIDVAMERLGPPISIEFGRMLLDVNLGASTEDALRALNDRLGSEDVDMVVTAILIQRNSGGNLAEVLDAVTETMRDRERLRGEINTLTAHQRLTGWILSLYPLALAGVFFVINSKMTSLLWTTLPGAVLLAIWLVLNVTGIFLMSRILHIDI